MGLKEIFYKKEFRGKIEKEGKIFKKYKKVPRFPWLHNKIIRSVIILVAFILFAMAATFSYRIYRAKKGNSEPQYNTGTYYLE